MTFQDTYKYGQLYVDASNVIEWLDDQDKLTDELGEVLEVFKDSFVDFTFDEDWNHGSFYDDKDQMPLVLLDWFGGYPGDSMDEANARAAKEWASDKSYIMAYSSYFGGCESVQLYFDPTNATLEQAQEAVDLVEGYKQYPVLDENLWSQLESERWVEMIEEMISDEERKRDTEFDKATKEYLYSEAQEYYGYWEEGYFEQDKWDDIVNKWFTGDVQLHQEDKLF